MAVVKPIGDPVIRSFGSALDLISGQVRADRTASVIDVWEKVVGDLQGRVVSQPTERRCGINGGVIISEDDSFILLATRSNGRRADFIVVAATHFKPKQT